MIAQQQIMQRVIEAIRQYFRLQQIGQCSVAQESELVTLTSELALRNLDTLERTIRSALWWHSGLDSNIKAVNLVQRNGPLDYWLFLCSGDGFKRENALKTLSTGAPNGFFFSLLLRRINDWVPQVRLAACRHLGSVASKTNPEFVVDALWNTLPHFSTWGRVDEEELQAILALLHLPEIAQRLKLQLQYAATGPASTVLAQVGRTSVLDHCLPELARVSIQPAVRAKAYRTMLERRAVWSTGREWRWISLKWSKGRWEPVFDERQVEVELPVTEILQTAIADKSARVRRVAGDFLVQSASNLTPDHRTFAERLSNDSTPSVAERGRFAVARADQAS